MCKNKFGFLEFSCRHLQQQTKGMLSTKNDNYNQADFDGFTVGSV